MTISEAFAFTETVSTTEWSFVTDSAGPDAETSDGVFQGFFDISAIANGDSFQFRVYEKAQGAGTQRVVWEAILNHAQAEPILVTPSFVFMHGWDMTWKKLAGTDRSIEGSIRKVV